ncbi:MAG TPA: ferritin-like domain-containing protein [Streptosporangiaceae bacterium]
MAEPRIVVEHREHLWYLLAEAAQVEHLIMCQYLYASFSLKTEPGDGLTAEQAAAVARWRDMLTGIAIEEMLHLALVFNVMTAIGAAPPLSRPNFPRDSDDLPGGIHFRLLPFGVDSLTHFLYLERPEGMERADAAGFVPTVPPRDPIEPGEAISRAQDFATVGHLYRGIEQGLATLAGRFGERALFVGPRRAQATPELFRWPQLIAVHDLDTATAAINEIIEQGEGARGDWRPAHYGRFLGIWEEYRKLTEADPAFEPAHPVIPAFTRQPYDITDPQPLLTDPLTRTVAEVFNLAYETLLQVLNRFFTHTDETDEQLRTLVDAAFRLMGGVLGPLGRTLARLPAGSGHPGRTAGPTFEMYYQFGNFVPWREPAWALLSERAAMLAVRSQNAAVSPGVPAAVKDAATAAAGIAGSLIAHVPPALRHAP